MKKEYVNRYEEDPRVKSAREALKSVEEEYKQTEREEAKAEKKKYREWYKSLDEDEQFAEDIKKAQAFIKEKKKAQSDSKKKRLKAESEERRKARDHHLIQLGAEINSALKQFFPEKYNDPEKDFCDEDLDILKIFLYMKTDKNQKLFPAYWTSAVKDYERHLNASKRDSTELDADEIF